MAERSISMPLGVVVERRRSTSPWQDWVWRPVAVIPGAPQVGPEGRELLRGEEALRYHAATLPLQLHRTDTAAYLTNLTGRLPVVYVVLRKATDGGPHAYRPFLVTVSPFEAGDYLESGEDIVEGVAMSEGLIAWVQAFVDRHHVEAPFVKRKRKRDVAATGQDRGSRATGER